MKIIISEKQLIHLKNVIGEEETETVTNDPVTNNTTSNDTTSITYPEVGKWESGVTRGAGNQIGNTKWSDVVGSQLTRGKGNKLK